MIGAWRCAVVLLSAAVASAAPYEPPPFTRFPDEPANLPPIERHETPTTWRRLRDALDGTRFHVIAGITAPVDIAGGVELVFPWRLRLATTFGVLPRTVGRAVNAQLVDHGAYARSLGDLVDASMERVLRWHVGVAVQPWAKHGFLVAAGYGIAWLHGTSTVPLVATALEMTLPDDVAAGDSRFAISSRLQLVDVELEWEWHPWCHWTIVIGIGAAVTVSARTHATLERSTDSRIEEIGARAAASLDHAYTTYVRTPVLSTFVGYEL